MSKKQIEEMARDICRHYEEGDLCRAYNEAVECDCDCWTGTYLAPKLYDAGYRKQEWISVDERLPELYVGVLVYMPGETPHPTVREGFINRWGKWYAGGFDRLQGEVVSWMPLPEPPKMRKEDDGK